MADLTPTSTLQVSPDNGSTFVLGVNQPQYLSFTIPRSGSENGDWQYGRVTAVMDGRYTVGFGSYDSSYLSPPFPDTAPPGGILAPTTFAGYGTFSYPLGVQSFGQTDTYSNVLLTLSPWPLPTPYPTDAGQTNGVKSASSTRYICPGTSTSLSWFDPFTASYTITDDSGNTYSAVQEPGNGVPFVQGLTVSPKKNTVYTFAATGYGGDTVTSTITVNIIPFSATISVNETNIVAGQPVHLTWSSVNASCVQFSGQIKPAGQAAGPVIAMDARGSNGALEPAIAQSGYGWPNFFGFSTYGAPNGWNYPADAYPSGTLTIYPQCTVTLFCTATSSGSCGTVQSNSVTITVAYPSDAGGASAGIKAGGLDTAKAPTGGGGGTTTTAVPRRSCLSAPGSRYCRAEDVSGGGVSFHRAFFPVPKLFGGTLWEVTSTVTTNAKDSAPALFLDQRGLLYCCFSRVTPPAVPADTSHDGVYVKRSDDLGTTFGAYMDASGTTERLLIPGGTLPAAASGNGSTLVAAITGNDKDGYQLMTAYKPAGSLTFSAPVVAVDSTGEPLALQNSGIALCRAAEGAGRWVLSCLLKSDSATSEWFSADNGASFTRISTS